jgi:hypothetical protein
VLKCSKRHWKGWKAEEELASRATLTWTDYAICLIASRGESGTRHDRERRKLALVCITIDISQYLSHKL